MLPSTRDSLDLPPGLLPPQLPLVLCGQGSQGAWGSTSQTHHYGWVPSSRRQLSTSSSSTSSSSGSSRSTATAYRRPVTASGRAPGSQNSHRARAAPASGLRIGYRRAAAFIVGIGVGGGVVSACTLLPHAIQHAVARWIPADLLCCARLFLHPHISRTCAHPPMQSII
jgi:hypothetical protein